LIGHQRNEYNFGFDGGEDDTARLNRFRYQVDVYATEYLRAFIERKSASSTDRDLPSGRRTTNVDELELQNRFLELRIPIADTDLTVRPGRHEFLFGSQRLASPRETTRAEPCRELGTLETRESSEPRWT